MQRLLTAWPAIIGLMIGLGGCEFAKEDRIRHRVAGMWEIVQVDISYYGMDGTVDSTQTLHDVGTWMLTDQVFIYNDGSMVYRMKRQVPSFTDYIRKARGRCNPALGIDSGVTMWSPDRNVNVRLTLVEHHIRDPEESLPCTYEVYRIAEFRRKKEMVLEYVRPDREGRLRYKEVWTLKRLKP